MSTEQALRRDVALANRIIERFGLSTAFGHASARIPGTNTFYISTRRSPGLADENDLLVIDTDGRILSGKGTPNSEFWIHARIYAARPDVNGIVHAHPLACIALTQIGEPHRVVHNQGGAFVDGIPEYERIGLIRSRELGDLVAQRLGKGIAVMMRGHGITTALADVRTATVSACFLEESADLQMRMLAAAGGDAKRIRAFTRAEAELTAGQTGPGVGVLLRRRGAEAARRLGDEGVAAVGREALRLRQAEVLAHHVRAEDERHHLVLRVAAAHALAPHAAIGADDEPLGRDVLQRAADQGGHFLGPLDLQRVVV